MKTDLSPKHICSIDETSILWFQKSNKYVVVSESLLSLIELFLQVTSEVLFIDTLQNSLHIEKGKCKSIFEDISIFLEDANTDSKDNSKRFSSLNIPTDSLEHSYLINGNLIKIHFETERIKSLIHPQIAHYLTKNTKVYDVTFDIFKTNNHLHFFKNKTYLDSYNTTMFHFLQGRFALELTNTIHDTDIKKWVATFHASTVSNNKEAIMIIGHSGSGKSTLSALLMANGFDVLADDFSPMYQDMKLYRHSSAISVKKGAFEMLSSKIENFDTLKTYSNGPKKVNLKYIPIPNESKDLNDKLPCQKIVLVKFDTSKPSQLRSISLENILETLIPESWISPDEAHALQFLNWLKTVNCFELNYSDNEFAIAKFETLFDS